MFEQAAAWVVDRIPALIRAVRAFRSPRHKQPPEPKLIFAQKALSGWVANVAPHGERVVHLRAQFTVTHQDPDVGVLG